MTAGATSKGRRGQTRQQLSRSAELAAASRDAGYGPATPRAERDAEIRRLAEAGCSNADMARLFGMSENGVRIIREGMVTRQLTAAEWELVQAFRAGKVRPW